MPGLKSQTVTRSFDAPLDTTELAADWIVARSFDMPKFNKKNKILVDADITFTSAFEASVVAFENPFFPTGEAAANLRHIFELVPGAGGPAFDITNLSHSLSGGNATFGGSTLLPFSGVETTSPRMLSDLGRVKGSGDFQIDARILGGPTGVGGPASMGEEDLTLTISITYDFIRTKDIIKGTGKAEKIKGSPARDMIEGKGGADKINAKGGADIVNAGKGADVVRGGGGADDLRGQGGKDKLIGGKGADQLLGGGGKDKLNGGGGKDILRGDGGKDVLTGGKGADIFVFTKGGAKDRVTDFETSRDLIDISNFGGPDFDFDRDLRFQNTADGVALDLAGKVIAVLDNLSAAALNEDHFIY